MLKVLSSILCDLDPKVKVIGQKAGICDGVPSTSALVHDCNKEVVAVFTVHGKICNADLKPIFWDCQSRDQARGRLGRNSRPRGRNFALNGNQGEVGVSVKKKKKNFFFFS